MRAITGAVRGKRRPGKARVTSHVVGLSLTTAMAVAFAGAAAAAPLAPGPESGAGVQPIEVPGNPDCVDVIPLTEFLEPEFDTDTAPVSGTTHLVRDGLEGDLTLTVSSTPPGQVPSGQLLSFSFNMGSELDVVAVLVKGGPNANFYDYRPLGGIAADDELHSPINESGNFADLSHVTFCLGKDDYRPPKPTKA